MSGGSAPALSSGLGSPQFERALRYPSQRLLVVRFTAGLLLGAALLVGLGYVLGHGPSGRSGSLLHALTKAVGLTGVSVALAVPLVVLTAWCIRRLWLELLAWSPGTIQVPEFQTAGKLEDVTAAQLTTRFRNTLSTLRLQTDAPSPGASPPSDFLDVLSKDTALQSAASGVSVAQVASLLRAAFPPTAVEVRGTLVTRKDSAGRCYGVSLQVVRLPKGGSRLSDVWDTSWERAVRRAADSATAAILPRTRRCKGPWITWRGYVMDPVVLGAYEDAARLESERRYHAALRCSYVALNGDPLNRAIRLQLGKLQEQLGLYLEALGTYQSILDAASPAGGRLPRRLYARQARRERRRQSDIARYRKIVLLSGDSIMQEWVAARMPRAAPEAYQREMGELLRRFCGERRDLRRVGDPQHCAPEPLAVALCETAAREASALESALRRWRLRHPHRKPHLLARTIAVTGVIVDDRLEVLKRASHQPPGASPSIEQRIGALDKQLQRCARVTGLKSYQSHYNAACCYALPLNDEYASDSTTDRDARRLLSARAIGQLQVAAGFADSAFLATRRDWLVVEDPDLVGLRRRPEFASFVSTYFPTPALEHRRWAAKHELIALYTYELLRLIAPVPASGWDKRSATMLAGASDRVLSTWWRDEAVLWRLVSNVASRPADWRSHIALLEAVDAWDGAFLAPRFHRFASDDGELARITGRLRQLDEVISAAGKPLLAPSDTTPDHKLAWFAEHGIPRTELRRACTRRGELWRRLDELLAGADAEASGLVASLHTSVEDLVSAETRTIGRSSA